MPSLSLTPALRADYNQMFNTCVTNLGKEAVVEDIVNNLLANKGRYLAVSGPLGIPWYFVAAIHNMESTRSFTSHLHNGDPLSHRTVQVPAGRPKTDTPPFTWEQSAADALTMKRLQDWTDWSVAGVLYKAELYNGIGYRAFHPHVKTPYLWSFSNKYTSGKYIADGTWSETAKSAQCGAAVLLRRMSERKLIEFDDQPLPAADEVPLVVHYAAQKPIDPAVILRTTTLQQWLTTHLGIFLKLDGWPGKSTSDAYKIVTGSFLPGDPRA